MGPRPGAANWWHSDRRNVILPLDKLAILIYTDSMEYFLEQLILGQFYVHQAIVTYFNERDADAHLDRWIEEGEIEQGVFRKVGNGYTVFRYIGTIKAKIDSLPLLTI